MVHGRNAGPHPNPSPGTLGEGLFASLQATLPSTRSEGRGALWAALGMRGIVWRRAGEEGSSQLVANRGGYAGSLSRNRPSASASAAEEDPEQPSPNGTSGSRG